MEMLGIVLIGLGVLLGIMAVKGSYKQLPMFTSYATTPLPTPVTPHHPE